MAKKEKPQIGIIQQSPCIYFLIISAFSTQITYADLQQKQRGTVSTTDRIKRKNRRPT
jgi:hypothetical protein